MRDVRHVGLANLGLDDQAGIICQAEQLALRDVTFLHVHRGHDAGERRVQRRLLQLVLQRAVALRDAGAFRLSTRTVHLPLQLLALLLRLGLRGRERRLGILQRCIRFIDAHRRTRRGVGPSRACSTRALGAGHAGEVLRGDRAGACRAVCAGSARYGHRARARCSWRSGGCGCCRCSGCRSLRGAAARATRQVRGEVARHLGEYVGHSGCGTTAVCGERRVVCSLRLIHLSLCLADGLVRAVVNGLVVGVELGFCLLQRLGGVGLSVRLLALLRGKLPVQLLGVHRDQELVLLHAVTGLDGDLLHLGLHRRGDVHCPNRSNAAVDHNAVGDVFRRRHGVVARLQAVRVLAVVSSTEAAGRCKQRHGGDYRDGAQLQRPAAVGGGVRGGNSGFGNQNFSSQTGAPTASSAKPTEESGRLGVQLR